MTNRTRLFTTAAFLIASTLGVAACGNKTPPKSTTTTRMQTETTTDTGNNTSTDVKETTVEQPNGASDVTRTETKTTSAPAPSPK